MKDKNKDKIENEKNLVESIIQQGFSEINILGHEMKNDGKATIDIAMWVDNESQEILRKLFRIIQTELTIITNVMGFQSKFESLSNILFQRFINDYVEEKDLEKSIETEINNLEKYIFLSPKKRYKSLEDKYEELSIEELIGFIKFFRERKIQILKILLDDFKNNKDKYNDFMKKQGYT